MKNTDTKSRDAVKFRLAAPKSVFFLTAIHHVDFNKTPKYVSTSQHFCDLHRSSHDKYPKQIWSTFPISCVEPRPNPNGSLTTKQTYQRNNWFQALLKHVFSVHDCLLSGRSPREIAFFQARSPRATRVFIYLFVFQFSTVRRILLSRGKGDDRTTMCN